MPKNRILPKDKYFAWAKEKYDVDYKSPDCEEIYNFNITNVKAAVEHVFDGRLDSFLQDCEKSYCCDLSRKYPKADAGLFMAPSELHVTWDKKPFSSVLDKVYRFNVVHKPAWDGEAPDVTPENWFLRFNDTVRTRLVCKYIDGPKYLAEHLRTFARRTLHIRADYDSRQKDDGYYAYHFYAQIPTYILTQGIPKPATVSVEIQITTQLQDVLSRITQYFYEKNRARREDDPDAWKWQIDDDRFRAAYLGHTLHLLEAIIQETRTRNPKKGARQIP